MVNPAIGLIVAQVIPPTISGIADYFRTLTEEETKRQAIAANRDVLIARITAEKATILAYFSERLLNAALRLMSSSSCSIMPLRARTTTN